MVHCHGGTGRTGTVLGCVLRELGVQAAEVIDFLDRVHKARGKPGWPESSWQRELVEHWKTCSTCALVAEAEPEGRGAHVGDDVNAPAILTCRRRDAPPG